MNKTVKKIWNAVTTVLVVIVVAVALLLVGARVVGLKVYTVLSGSMEPHFHTGSVIYVRNVHPQELEVGDIITFMLNESTVATHRIVEILPDGNDPSVLRFRTKGDANNEADSGAVHMNNIIGKPIFSIPYFGYVANYIQAPPGSYVAIAGGALLLILVFLPDLFSDSKKDKQVNNAEDNA